MPSLNDFAQIRTEDVPLARLTSMRVGGPARFLFEPRSVDELRELRDALVAQGVLFRVIGGGTNVIAGETGFAGAVIRLAGEFSKVSFDGATATAGAAVSLPRLVRECAARGSSGTEGLVGIPGTIGGALVMNAGGRWGEIGQIVASVRVLTGAGEVRDLERSQIVFSYRRSSLRGVIVLSAAFALKESDPGAVESATTQFLARKRSSQDLGAASAGCVFRNPPSGDSAGALIDRAGLKDFEIGGARVSAIHANFIVNTGSATAGDVFALAELVRAKVREKFGVDLEFEVELW